MHILILLEKTIPTINFAKDVLREIGTILIVPFDNLSIKVEASF